MDKDKAKAIELPVWQAPNDYVSLTHNRDELVIYFNIWVAPALYSRYTGILKFTKVWAVKLERNKQLSYYPDREDDNFTSCYWIINNSSWLEKLTKQRDAEAPDWREYDISNYCHYIIQSHDFYIEIIADTISFSQKRLKKRFCLI